MVLRLWNSYRRQGLKATISAVLTFARKKVHLNETHVWYELPLGTDRLRVAELPGLSLIQAGKSDLPLLDQLPTVAPHEAGRRMKAGHDLWLLLKGPKPVFACWVFHGSVPAVAARHGQIVLPPEIVALEDSVASLAYRGRGIPLAVWSKIADHLEQTAATAIITKVEEDNSTARRAFEKAGFSEIATVHVLRRGPWRTLSIRAGSSATASWVAEQLAH